MIGVEWLFVLTQNHSHTPAVRTSIANCKNKEKIYKKKKRFPMITNWNRKLCKIIRKRKKKNSTWPFHGRGKKYICTTWQLAFYDCGSFILCTEKKGRENPQVLLQLLFLYIFTCCSAKELLTTDIDVTEWFLGFGTCVCYFLNNINKNIEKVLQKQKYKQVELFFRNI